VRRDRSRFNAVKHGFRAEKVILPNENPAALQERLDQWTGDLQPRNSVEQYLVDRGVRLSWQLDRVTRAQDARTTTQMIEAGSEEASLQAEEILDIGKRLFWDNRGPLNFYPHRPIRDVSSPGDGGPRTSFCESPDDPDQPTRSTCTARPTTPVRSIRTERPNAQHKSLSNSKIDPSATDVGNFVHCVTLHVLPSSWPPARD
jgi:hypothetical protein